MNRVFNIVLTGGPCAGKTTSLSVIEQKLSNLNYKVIIVDEVATRVIKSGITPGIGKAFNELMANIQYNDYLNYNKIARLEAYSKYKGIVIIYDRALLDNKAYSESDYSFYDSIHKLGLTVQSIYSMYDGVFHLVTAAIGAQEFYGNSNNKARTETIDEAVKLDRRTLNAWTGHHHLRVIANNANNFEGKVNNLYKEILNLLGEPEPLEIERKYLIKRPSIQELESLNAVKVRIEQTYLNSLDHSTERRIRKRGLLGDFSYYYTEKREISAGVRVECERKITEQEYFRYLLEADKSKKTILKDRYCFIYDNRCFELDIYDFWDNKAILEIEVSSLGEKINTPKIIEIIKDVTFNLKYKNSNLAISYNL